VLLNENRGVVEGATGQAGHGHHLSDESKGKRKRSSGAGDPATDSAVNGNTRSQGIDRSVRDESRQRRDLRSAREVVAFLSQRRRKDDNLLHDRRTHQADDGKIFLDSEKSPGPMFVRLARDQLPAPDLPYPETDRRGNILAILETLDIESERGRIGSNNCSASSTSPILRAARLLPVGRGEKAGEITRALVTSPRFILLDEPSRDRPLAVADIQKNHPELKSRASGRNLDHNVRETLSVCDRAYILNEGTVLIEGLRRSSRRVRSPEVLPG